MYGLSDPDTLCRVGDVPVGQVLDVDVAGQAVVEPDAHARRLARTCAGVEVVPYLKERTLQLLTMMKGR